MIIPIDDHTVVIEDENDLKSVVAQGGDVNITHVHFANDIEMTAGITINPARSLLVIDGIDPRNPGVIHSFTDVYSNTIASTLAVRASSSIQLTLSNMIMIGRNWYGFPHIEDGYTTSSLTVSYENVKYTGRQISYHTSGLTRYIDCDIEIVNITSSWTGEEVGEVNRVEIGGKTTITKSNENDAIFYFLGSSATNYLKILSNADVTISTPHYFMYASGRVVAYTIETGASLKLSTNTGISYASGHQVSPFIVEENASFEYTQASSSTSVYIPGTLTVKQGARFFMRADYTTSSPLINFVTSGSNLNLNLENPKSFVLYKKNTPAVSFSYSRPFLLSGGQVNFWQNAANFPAAGGLSDPPLYRWRNLDQSVFEITGNVGSSMSGVASTLDDPNETPLSNLQLQNARVLSLGELPLEISSVLSRSSHISGTTDPQADVKVEYSDDVGAKVLTGTADNSGDFSIPIPAPIPPETQLNVTANTPFLFTTVTGIVQDGPLYIREAPEHISFVMPPISQTPLILGRDTNEAVVVVDDRYSRTDWVLQAAIDGPMQTSSGYTLPDSVVFVPERSTFADREVLSVYIPLDTHYGTEGLGTTYVTWADNIGILLNLNTPIHFGVEYKAHILWSVRPA